MPDLPVPLGFENRMSRFRDILMAAIGSGETFTPLSSRFNTCGTNDAQPTVIGSSEIGETPLLEPIQFCGIDPILWNQWPSFEYDLVKPKRIVSK